ncbi:hypothetical protein VE00_10187 [Pseudogymnoascus sp. WSF 3629]|nr:hypothetical protein VE00_10187 [Pseudogymnoascus sp. WSF 3629]
MPVKPLGLIHAGSMHDLISASKARISKTDSSSSNPRTLEGPDLEVAEEIMDVDKDINPADVELVRV